MNPEPDYLAAVKYDNLDNIPFPPREEIVEPRSIRNRIIRILSWTTLVPILMLGLLQSQQIQQTMHAADDAQLAMVNYIAENVRTTIDAGERVLRVLADVQGLGTADRDALQQALDRLVERSARSTLWAAVVFSETGELTALTLRPEAGLEPAELVRALQPWTEKEAGSHVLRLPGKGPFIVIAARSHGRVSMALYASAFVTETLELAAGERRFDVALVDENDLPVSCLDRADSSGINHALEGIANGRAELAGHPSGFMVRTQAKRDVAQIKAYAQVPGTGWIAASSEPLRMRDQALLASIETSGVFLILAVLLTVIVGSVMTQPLTRSISTLMRALEDFGKAGHFDSIRPQLEKDGFSELVELGKTFERMAHDVTESRKKLEELNAGLEAQVEERTRSLLTRNAELRSLQRLLMPMEGKEENRMNSLKLHVSECMACFRTLLEMPDLEFVSAGSSPEGRLFRVELSGVTHGWLASKRTTRPTQDQKESLQRLANSLAIVLANDALVEQLEQEHATMTVVFESITDGIIILGRSGRIIYANDFANRMLNDGASLIGVQARELLQRQYGDRLPDEAEFSHKRLMRRTDKAETQTIDLAGFLVNDLPGFSGVRRGLLLRDISREAGLEAMKENLMSVVAHELQTPVTALRLLAENLLHRMSEEEREKRADAEAFLTETDRLSRLIDDLLDVSRIEGGAMRLDKKVVQIASLIDRAARLTQARAPIRVERRIDEDAEAVDVDPARLIQVFINLFVNAARHRKNDQPCAQCRVDVRRTADGALEIQVADFGQGIEPERLGRLFQPFYQSDMTTKRSSGGAGLGLTIVKGIIEAHQGKVCVQSVPGESTVFTLTLPA